MRIYFMSICGTGMGNGALLMRSLGHEVTGADQNTYPPMSDQLANAGVEILEGYDAARLQKLNPDLVVVGNVNTRGNPEVEWLLESHAIPFVSLPELLAREILRKRRTLVVAGTHGKTTTSSLAAFLLEKGGMQPGYLIGGVPRDLPGGARAGAMDAPFVIEGDEYDSAFFDKRSKFIHYCPDVLVLNNLEFDHGDIFRDLQDIQRTFSHLIKLVPRNGYILANSDDPNLEELLHVDWAPVLRVGLGDRADLKITNFEEGPEGSRFDLIFRGRPWARVEWRLWGLYNARNAAMAAMAAALGKGLDDPIQFNLDSLSTFRGVKRRQEILCQTGDLTLMTDFGHHPTAIRDTLSSLRDRFPGHRLVMCFEARSNTACRKIHESAFELAFDEADEVHLGSVFRAERYSDSERIDLVGMARRLGEKACHHQSNEDLRRTLDDRLGSLGKAVVVFFSNGSFDGIPQGIVAGIRAREEGASVK
ncbi:MAG: UDP-N-acetylmuramate--L-alanine ligase [Opitutales bacterium]|jgi:UDP-N-acetylmuramate: L-alanyl-gamma-D-glutamyl-meso-diaminopimelate ligase